MSDPVMQSPLHPFALETEARTIDGTHGVWANEIRNLVYVGLRGSATDPAFVQGVSAIAGIALPLGSCTFSTADGVKVLWLSPDEWMMICPRSRLSGLVKELQASLANVRCQIVDNSGGFTQIYLEGRNALDVLRHVSVYDFAALEPGRVVGTTFGKSSVYAHRQGGGYCLMLRRSFADYIWRYLVRAATPYGLGIARIETAADASHGVAT